MANTCIICGQKAGNSEHVFPAALGGRRTNKQIYCKEHNNYFGRHVAVLEKQLSLLNALLEIRPDRRDKPKPFLFSDKNGQKLSLLGSKIEVAPPPSLTELALSPGTNISLEFSSIKQLEDWKIAQKELGYDVRLDASDALVHQRHFTDSLNLSLILGGPAGLQAVGYLGLTFFAHFFPNLARNEKIRLLKNYLVSVVSETSADDLKPEFVWWDKRNTVDLLGENCFEFGHAVAVGVSSSGHAHAFVSFFSTLNFIINIGKVDSATEQMAYLFIDPMAQNAGGSWSDTRSYHCSIASSPSVEDLSLIINSGLRQASFEKLFLKIAKFHHREYINDINKDLKIWKDQDSIDSEQFANNIVRKHSQRVLNKIIEIAEDMQRELLAKNPEFSLYAEQFSNLIKMDDTQPSGLTITTTILLELAMTVLINSLSQKLKLTQLSADLIADSINGMTAQQLFVLHVFEPILLRVTNFSE